MEYPPPGTALVEELDQKLLVQLRDGRKIIGVLRSFDQFANLVLEHAVERIIVGTQYCDIPLGIYVLRGENLVLMGQVDPAKEVPPGLTEVTEPEIRQAIRAEKEAARLKGSMLARFDFLVSAVLGVARASSATGCVLCGMSNNNCPQVLYAHIFVLPCANGSLWAWVFPCRQRKQGQVFCQLNDIMHGMNSVDWPVVVPVWLFGGRMTGLLS